MDFLITFAILFSIPVISSGLTLKAWAHLAKGNI